MRFLIAGLLFALFASVAAQGEPHRYYESDHQLMAWFPLAETHWRMPGSLQIGDIEPLEGFFYSSQFSYSSGLSLAVAGLGAHAIAAPKLAVTMGAIGCFYSCISAIGNSRRPDLVFSTDYLFELRMTLHSPEAKHLAEMVRGRPQVWTERAGPVIHPQSLVIRTDETANVVEARVNILPARGEEAYGKLPAQVAANQLRSCSRVFSAFHRNSGRSHYEPDLVAYDLTKE